MTNNNENNQNFLQGNRYLERGDFEKAIECYSAAISEGFKEAKVYNNKALAEKGNNLEELAIIDLRRAIKLNPKFPEAHNNLGNIFVQQNNITDAILEYKKAIKLRPKYKEAINNLGTAWQNLGDLDKAISCYKRALKIDPEYDNALNNLGVVYQNTGRLKSAEKMLKKSLKVSPNYISSHYNLSLTYLEMGKYDMAIKSAEDAIDLFPDYQDAIHTLAQLYKNTCDWGKSTYYKTRLAILTKDAIKNNYRPGETPFFSISNYEDNKRNLEVAKLWSQHIAPKSSSTKPTFKPPKKDKIINVGYFSSDFRNHAIGHQITNLFKHHDRKRFKVFVYSYGPDDKSYWLKTTKKYADRFRDVTTETYLETVEIMKKDGIDILVDINGHTKGTRLQVSALRAAPIQITYLGFPGSTGADFFDYSIVDKTIVPKSASKYYSEKLVYMPDCYQVSSYEHFRKVSTTRSEHKLPKGAVVYCSFNNSYKIEKDTFEVWLNILKKVPKSVLWLLEENEDAKKNLLAKTSEAGINKKRVIFTKKVSLNKHLARLALADIALDTKPYNGGATTSNALWAGVPVITFRGSSYMSRMSTSIISAVGVSELIAKDWSAYEKIAVNLGKNKKKLDSLKEKISENKKTSPHFDTKLFTKNLESSYEIMWDRYIRGVKKLQHIEVKK